LNASYLSSNAAVASFAERPKKASAGIGLPGPLALNLKPVTAGF